MPCQSCYNEVEVGYKPPPKDQKTEFWECIIQKCEDRVNKLKIRKEELNAAIKKMQMQLPSMFIPTTDGDESGGKSLNSPSDSLTSKSPSTDETETASIGINSAPEMNTCGCNTVDGSFHDDGYVMAQRAAADAKESQASGKSISSASHKSACGSHKSTPQETTPTPSRKEVKIEDSPVDKISFIDSEKSMSSQQRRVNNHRPTPEIDSIWSFLSKGDQSSPNAPTNTCVSCATSSKPVTPPPPSPAMTNDQTSFSTYTYTDTETTSNSRASTSSRDSSRAPRRKHVKCSVSESSRDTTSTPSKARSDTTATCPCSTPYAVQALMKTYTCLHTQLPEDLWPTRDTTGPVIPCMETDDSFSVDSLTTTPCIVAKISAWSMNSTNTYRADSICSTLSEIERPSCYSQTSNSRLKRLVNYDRLHVETHEGVSIYPDRTASLCQTVNSAFSRIPLRHRSYRSKHVLDNHVMLCFSRPHSHRGSTESFHSCKLTSNVL